MLKQSPPDLEQYSKEVLIKFILENSHFKYPMRSIESIDLEVNFKRISTEVNNLMEEQKTLSGIEWIECNEKITELWAESEKLMSKHDR